MSGPQVSKRRSDRASGLASSGGEAELRRSLLYSEELGVDLAKGTDREFFKWFLASLLLGGRISETIAKNTYRAFARHRLLGARAILRVGRSYLVDPIMREGGYVRYDESKSTQIVRDCASLLADYGGRLSRLHDLATDAADLERRLLQFYGVGPITTNIFLREMRPYWSKADPAPLPIVRELARTGGMNLDSYDRKSVTFCRIEAGLIRARRQGLLRERATARHPARRGVG